MMIYDIEFRLTIQRFTDDCCTAVRGVAHARGGFLPAVGMHIGNSPLITICQVYWQPVGKPDGVLLGTQQLVASCELITDGEFLIDARRYRWQSLEEAERWVADETCLPWVFETIPNEE